MFCPGCVKAVYQFGIGAGMQPETLVCNGFWVSAYPLDFFFPFWGQCTQAPAFQLLQQCVGLSQKLSEGLDREPKAEDFGALWILNVKSFHFDLDGTASLRFGAQFGAPPELIALA